MDEQLLAAIEHDEHREARLGNRRTAHELGLLRAEVMRAWTEHDLSPVEYLAKVSKDRSGSLDHLRAGFLSDEEARRRWVGKYSKHFAEASPVPVLRVAELTHQQAQYRQIATVVAAIGIGSALAAWIAAIVLGFLAVLILPGLVLGAVGGGVALHLNGKRRGEELVPKQQARLEAADDPWERARRDAHHALDRDHPLRLDSTQYAAMVDTLDDETRVMLVQYRPTSGGYTRRVVQNRRFAADRLTEAASCKALFERRAERYEAEARARSATIMDAVSTRRIERQTDDASRALAREEAAQLAVALGGERVAIAPRRLR